MGLKEVLSKMKIVEMEPEEAPLPAAPAGAPTSPGSAADIHDLLGSVPPPREIDESALARHAAPADAGAGEAPGGEIPDFAAVYSAAGISDPPHGYSAFKVLEILSSPEFAN